MTELLTDMQTSRLKKLAGIRRFLLAAVLASSFGCADRAEPERVQEHPGKEIYRKYCLACHQGGIANSPTYGKPEDWVERLEKGRDAMVKSVIEGIPPGMPIKGLCTGCTDEELGHAVDYMLVPVLPADSVQNINETVDKR